MVRHRRSFSCSTYFFSGGLHPPFPHFFLPLFFSSLFLSPFPSTCIEVVDKYKSGCLHNTTQSLYIPFLTKTRQKKKKWMKSLDSLVIVGDCWFTIEFHRLSQFNFTMSTLLHPYYTTWPMLLRHSLPVAKEEQEEEKEQFDEQKQNTVDWSGEVPFRCWPSPHYLLLLLLMMIPHKLPATTSNQSFVTELYVLARATQSLIQELFYYVVSL